MALNQSPDRSDVINEAYVSGVISVTSSQVLAAASGTALQERQELVIYNKSNLTLYFGPSGVTTSTGIPIEPQEIVNLPFGPNIEVYLVVASGTAEVIVQELA